MTLIRNLSIDYKFIILFGLTGFICSVLAGLAFGIKPGVLISRSFFFTLAFCGIGFGIIFVIKKYIPELYEAISDMKIGAAGSESEEAVRVSEQEVVSGLPAGGDVPAPEMSQTGEFKETKSEDMARFDTLIGAGDRISTSEGKLGKHILSKDKFGQYEPKIIAQAIRTMIKRDEG
ncbi:MAG: hypothetical protein MUD12_03565 [Spirochaetes bacterium]|jgi:hypothetical protein|nr:hypothetical protein [Spirochaetota bacterium]